MADLKDEASESQSVATKSVPKVSAFEKFFAEPVSYDYGKYVVWANSDHEALEKLVAYFDDWNWIPKENHKYVIYQFRSTLQRAWVKWHGGLDDDGEMHNGWFLYEGDTHYGEARYKPVWVGIWDKHYFKHGHHIEPTVDEYGWRRSNNDCNICSQISQARLSACSPQTRTPRAGRLRRNQ